MTYTGQTYQIPCEKGGFNGSKNIDNIPPEAMVHPSRNLNLHRGGREPRGGTSLVNGAAFSGTPRVMGMYDFTLLNGTQFVMTATGDGKIYKDDTSTIKTGLGTNKVTNFTTFDNELYICNGANAPATWDGAAAGTSALTNPAADWTGSNQPIQFVKHGRGNSERMWAILPAGVYASAEGNAKEFVTGVVNIPISTDDNSGLVGGVEFGDRIILFSKRKSYIIDDADTNTSNWGYEGAIWDGGAASWRLIVKTPNDVICMMEDGEIYSVTAVQQYGDYKAASLTRPAFINEWIKEYVNLAYIADFHAVYDPNLRAIKWFMVRQGQTQVDMALVYFVDRGPLEGWMPHDNQSYVSGYSASCSTLIRAGTGDYRVYTGDYLGKVWRLETVNKNDNNNAYYKGFKSPYLVFDNARVTKKYRRGWVITEPKGSYNVYIYPYIDGTQKSQQSIDLAGTGGVLDSFTLDTSVLGGQEMVDKEFDIGEKGKRIAFEVYNNNVNEDFFMSSLHVDFKNLGASPSA